MRQKPRTIDNQRRASDILVNSKVEHRLRIVARLASAAERNAPLLLEVLLRIALVVLDRRHLTWEVARSKSVDSDFETLEIDSELLGQADGGGLGSVVRELAVLALLGDAGDGADVENGACVGEAVVLGCTEKGQESGGGEVVACDVDLVDPGPVVEGLVVQHGLANLGRGALGGAFGAVVDWGVRNQQDSPPHDVRKLIAYLM